jgi:hypothetical protein
MIMQYKNLENNILTLDSGDKEIKFDINRVNRYSSSMQLNTANSNLVIRLLLKNMGINYLSIFEIPYFQSLLQNIVIF